MAKGHNRLARSLNAFLQEIYTYVRALEHGRLVVCIADVHSSIMRSQECIRVAFGSLRHNAAHRAMPWKTGGLVRTYVRISFFQRGVRRPTTRYRSAVASADGTLLLSATAVKIVKKLLEQTADTHRRSLGNNSNATGRVDCERQEP